MGRRRHHWTAAITEFGEEQRAAHHVEKRGFSYYLPETLLENSQGEYTRRSLLFPGYILVKLKRGWENLLHVRGIRRFLLVDSRPLQVPQREIDILRGLEDENGFVTFFPRLRPGDSVRVGDGGGAFTSCVGTMLKTSSGQCEVLLTLLGRSVAMSFDKRIIEAA